MGDDLLLFDAGLGYSDEQGRLILHENIRKAGFSPDDVTMVLMSHLHFDHSGGMIHQGDRFFSYVTQYAHTKTLERNRFLEAQDSPAALKERINT